jgi:hypothetical protein
VSSSFDTGFDKTGKDLAPDNKDDQLNEYERNLARKILKAWLDWPDETKFNILDHVALNGRLGIGQIVGFAQFTPQVASNVDTAESTTSTSYTNLGTVGPELAELPRGRYVIGFNATITGTAPGTPHMGIRVNSTEPSDADALKYVLGTTASPFKWLQKDLTESSNTLTARYRSSSGNAAIFGSRSMVVFRYANL